LRPCGSRRSRRRSRPRQVAPMKLAPPEKVAPEKRTWRGKISLLAKKRSNSTFEKSISNASSRSATRMQPETGLLCPKAAATASHARPESGVSSAPACRPAVTSRSRRSSPIRPVMQRFQTPRFLACSTEASAAGPRYSVARRYQGLSSGLICASQPSGRSLSRPAKGNDDDAIMAAHDPPAKLRPGAPPPAFAISAAASWVPRKMLGAL
jgi:hypothetical protein